MCACREDPEMKGSTMVCINEPFRDWAVGKAKSCVLGGNGRNVSAALLCDNTSISDADRAHELGESDSHHEESVALFGDSLESGAQYSCVRQDDGVWDGIRRAAVTCKHVYGASDHSTNQTPIPKQVVRPSAPPPKFQIYKYDPDGTVAIVVPVNTTDEQLKSLLWLFRERVRTHCLGSA